MKDFDDYIRAHIEEEGPQVPDFIHEQIAHMLDALPARFPRRRPKLISHVAPIAACIAFTLIGILPNISISYARAVADIPVLGALVQVFTIRNYTYDDGNHELSVTVPSVVDPGHESAVDLINGDVSQLTDAVINRFYQDLELSNKSGYGSVNVSYQTLTNSPDWFTLKLTVTEVVGSSNTYEKYYHIDRKTGDYVTFSDLFSKDSYRQLEELIHAQMKQQMEDDPSLRYWTDQSDSVSNFATLDDLQNFYFTASGDLMIVYDKYEVAPGYMDCPEFAISPEEYQNLISPSFLSTFAGR